MSTATTPQPRPPASPTPATPASAGPRDAGTSAAGASREARRLAAAILEVLAGSRSPQAAAQALALSLPRYYALEQRALQGLLAACEPRPRGRAPSAAAELAALRRRCAQLERACARQQALVRVAQRTVGLAPVPTPPPRGKGTKRRSRRPAVRALQAAARLQTEATAAEPASSDNGMSVP